ncbi:MAG: hypothetical protein GC154_05675 [bacterium]|nr:hypothetical protein [bacterium]
MQSFKRSANRGAALFAPLVLVLVFCARVSAQQELFFWMNPNLDEFRLHTEYDGQWYGGNEVDNAGDNLDMMKHRLQLAAPLFKNDDHFFALSSSLEYWDVDTRVKFPDSGGDFPSDLYDLKFAANYFHYFDNGWTAGGVLSVGSASDKPFNSGDEVEVQFNGFLRIPHVDDNYWVFVLNYSNNREFLNNVPIPGFGYWYQPSDRLFILAGIPFLALKAEPIDNVIVRASYIPLRNIDAEIAYQFNERIEVFSGFSWDNQRFMPAGRSNNDDRLFYYEKDVEGGVRYALCEAAKLEVAGGYAFDRFFFTGEDYDDRNHDRIDIEDGPYVRGKITVRF